MTFGVKTAETGAVNPNNSRHAGRKQSADVKVKEGGGSVKPKLLDKDGNTCRAYAH